MRSLGSLVIFAALVAAAASSGSAFMPGEWYAALNKPSWTPPNWVFPVAWTILYILIAIAGWLAWRAGGWTPALLAWGAGLVLNALWSYLMFGRHDIALALADLVALWGAIVVFIITAWPVSRGASYLFLPYLAWVTFAGALNFAVWQMN
ncbi:MULTISPECIES: TspO/MBR family protein [unclassified Hyphomicrobium]|uniref:TspO/MBR family protein n=1 Tax=unclassified Hyphomicrobium TaxID=2619925 RepID=UPI000213DFC8|nr:MULTISPECIES: TspO/MBR family protein [unclassified Hyphomicrobium]CCB66428.1 Protein CrtK [Hyphomicrobium sp. MC1]